MEDAFSCYREDDSDWFDAWRMQPSCPASRRETPVAQSEQEPEPKHSQPLSHHSACPALRPDQKNKRPSDKLQILSWNPVPMRRSDPSLLASHLNGPWHVVCVQEGSGFVNDLSSLTWSPSTTVLCPATRTPLSAATRAR